MADPDEKTAKVIVPDYQLSLAIGKEGQNARLAARLTGFKIDIKSETQAREAGDFDYVKKRNTRKRTITMSPQQRRKPSLQKKTSTRMMWKQQRKPETKSN